MIITNRQNLPQTLVNAINSHEHKSDADISASQLLKSPRAFWLGIRHNAEIEQDVSSMIWALFGTAVHGIAEMGESKNSLAEEYFSKVQVGDFSVSGTADLYEDGIIYDWKTVSVWSLIFLDDSKLAEYISQLNTYAYFFRRANMKVKGLKIVMIMRDWQKSKADFDCKYPSSQVKVLDIPLFSQYETGEYLKARIDYLMSFKDVPDDELPLCTKSYRWAKPSKWALMKIGRKSAVKLYDIEDEAKNEAYNLGSNHYVEERKADEWKRCEYCSARKFCNQTEFIETPIRENPELKCEMSYEKFMEVVG